MIEQITVGDYVAAAIGEPTTKFKHTRAGLIVPYFYSPKPKRPTHFDFFAGAGGFGCGMVRAGYETVGANEWDEYASITYMHNLGHYPMQIHYLDGEEGKKRLEKALVSSYGLKGYKYDEGITDDHIKQLGGKVTKRREKLLELGLPEDAERECGTENIMIPNFLTAGGGYVSHYPEYQPGCRNFWFGDIHKLTGKMILDTLGMSVGDIDVVTGGPPCQGFSRAGKQEAGDQRNSLVYEYARLIVELQPKTFVMENVPDLENFMDVDGVPIIDKFCFMLQEGGFGRWEMLKKSLLSYPNAGVGINSMNCKNSKRTIKPAKVKPTPTPTPESNQLSLF